MQMENLNPHTLMCLPSQLLKNNPVWHCFSSGQEANSPYLITLQGHPYGQHLTLAHCPPLLVCAFAVKFSGVAREALSQLKSCLPLFIRVYINILEPITGLRRDTTIKIHIYTHRYLIYLLANT